MAASKNFQIDRRVGIAMDALSPSQKAVLKPILQTKDGFVAHERRPGVRKKLSISRPLYSMKAGADMLVIYSRHDEDIVVEDIIRKATMDRFAVKRKGKSKTKTKTLKKGRGGIQVKRGDGTKTREA